MGAVMFYHEIIDDRSKFIAVQEITDITDGSALYGQRTFKFNLADGSTRVRTFEAPDWDKWQQSILDGGFVVNPHP